MENCKIWLRNRLIECKGETTEETSAAAKKRGFKKSELREAKKQLNVVTVSGCRSGIVRKWYWEMPSLPYHTYTTESSPEDTQGSPIQGLPPLIFETEVEVKANLKLEKINEKSLEKLLVREVKKLGGAALKYHNSFDTAFPDRLILLPGGRVWWVELKSPGKKPTKLQALKIKQLQKLGFGATIVDSLESLNYLLPKLQLLSLCQNSECKENQNE